VKTRGESQGNPGAGLFVAIQPGSWLASSSDLTCVQQVRHFIERDRFADEVALDLIAVEEPETFGLLLFLEPSAITLMPRLSPA
jgi:hypothetical protein